MRRDRISRLADRRRLYTNETYEQARSLLRHARLPIPAADCAQQRNFEADLFHQVLDSHSSFTVFTFGIQRVRPYPDTIELVVENKHRADRLLRAILPSYEPGGEVHGMPGLRIRQRTSKGIELHVAGRHTSAWLTGQPPTVWKQAETAALETVADISWKPLWRGPEEWSQEELTFERRWNTGEWAQNFQSGARRRTPTPSPT
jgi:hypothetical protein